MLWKVRFWGEIWVRLSDLPLLPQIHISLFSLLCLGIWLTASVLGGKNERGERGEVCGVHLGLGADSAHKYLGYRTGRKKQWCAGGTGQAFPWLAKAPAMQSTLRLHREIRRAWTPVCHCSRCSWCPHGVSQGQLAPDQLRPALPETMPIQGRDTRCH